VKRAKSGGRDFKKGQSGNPKGRPVEAPEIKALKAVTNEHIKEIVELLLNNNIAKLTELSESTTEPMLTVLYARGILYAYENSDLSSIESTLNRVAGKPKENINHTGTIGWEQLVAAANKEEA